MAAGQPLDDADRAPWLAAIGAWIDQRIASGSPGVVTCSALRAAYRRILTVSRPEVRIVHPSGPRALIAERLAQRRGHFMPAALLDSQFAALEEPSPAERAITVDIDQSPPAQVAAVLRRLEGEGAIPPFTRS
jgi:gluconokinase